MTSPARRWMSYLGLPVLIFFELFGWYLMRTGLVPYVLDEGLPNEDVGTIFQAMSYSGLVGLVLAGLLAIPFGPALPMVLGACILIVGMVATVLLPPELVTLAMVIAGLGHSMLRPAIWGAAASAFGKEHSSIRSSLLVLLYAAANLAAVFSSGLAEIVRDADMRRLPILVGTGMELLVLFLVVAFAAAVFLTRDKTQPKPPKPPPSFLALGVAFGVVMLIGIPVGALLGGWEVAFELVRYDGPLNGELEYRSLMYANTATVVVAGVVAAAVLGGLHLTKVRVPPLLLAALGLFGTMLAMTVFLMIDPGDPSVGALLGGMVILGASEVLVVPMIFAGVGGDLPYRLETAVFALYLLLAQLPGLLMQLVDDPSEMMRFATWAGLFLTLPLAIALAAAATRLRRILEPDDPVPVDTIPVETVTAEPVDSPGATKPLSF